MHLRLICRVADQYRPNGYLAPHEEHGIIYDKALEIINEEFDKYGLKEFIVSCYREQSPFVSRRSSDAKGNGLILHYWQEMIVCLNIADHAVYNKVKLKHPKMVPVFNGDALFIGKNSQPMELQYWKR